MKSNTVRQKDIAIALNVSVNTVSRALRNMDDISDALKIRVRDKALELGYVPNSLAVKLKTGNSKTIAVAFDNLTNPYFTIMASKLFNLIKERSYNTIIFPCQNDNNNIDIQTFSEILQSDVDGILSFLDFDEDVKKSKSSNYVPIVLVGRLSSGNMASSFTNDYEGGILVGNYFKEKGFHRVLYLSPDYIENSSRRYNGLVSSFGEENIVSLTYRNENDIDEILEKLDINSIDGAFCFNDVLATMFKRYIDKKKLDIEVVGFDDLHQELPFVEDITSVHYDFDEVANNAVNILFDIINGKNNKKSQIEVPVTLKIKGEIHEK